MPASILTILENLNTKVTSENIEDLRFLPAVLDEVKKAVEKELKAKGLSDREHNREVARVLGKFTEWVEKSSVLLKTA